MSRAVGFMARRSRMVTAPTWASSHSVEAALVASSLESHSWQSWPASEHEEEEQSISSESWRIVTTVGTGTSTLRVIMMANCYYSSWEEEFDRLFDVVCQIRIMAGWGG